jgi:hypothetical protein
MLRFTFLCGCGKARIQPEAQTDWPWHFCFWCQKSMWYQKSPLYFIDIAHCEGELETCFSKWAGFIVVVNMSNITFHDRWLVKLKGNGEVNQPGDEHWSWRVSGDLSPSDCRVKTHPESVGTILPSSYPFLTPLILSASGNVSDGAPFFRYLAQLRQEFRWSPLGNQCQQLDASFSIGTHIYSFDCLLSPITGR